MPTGDPYCAVHGFLPCDCWKFIRPAAPSFQFVKEKTLAEALKAKAQKATEKSILGKLEAMLDEAANQGHTKFKIKLQDIGLYGQTLNETVTYLESQGLTCDVHTETISWDSTLHEQAYFLQISW